MMLPGIDPDGSRTAQQSVSNTLALLIVSLCPFVFSMSGKIYLAGALVLSAGFFWCAIRFSRQLTLATRAAVVFGVHHLPAAAAWRRWSGTS